MQEMLGLRLQIQLIFPALIEMIIIIKINWNVK